MKITAEEKQLILKRRSKINAGKSNFKNFKKMFPLVKDIQSSKKKGVDVEEIFKHLKKFYNTGPIKKITVGDDLGGWMEFVSISPKKDFGFMLIRTYSGVPPLYIGVKNKDKMKEIRKNLKEKDFLK